MHVLRKIIETVKPGGSILDLQVVRPNPVVESEGRALGEIDGAALFRKADAAAVAIDAEVRAGRLAEEARDDHDVWEHYPNGVELIDDFAGRQRKLPVEALPQLRRLGPCAVRERCRLRLLRVVHV